MQRYFAKSKQEHNFILNNDDLRHIKTVMRMKENDEILVVFEQKTYLCVIIDIQSDIKIKIKEEIEQKEEEIPKVTLIIPILKEQKMDYILQKATELGVDEFIPFYAERSVIKEKEEKQSKKLERWNRIVKEASEQSHRLTIPNIRKITSLEEIMKLDGTNIVCSTAEKNTNIKKILKTLTKCDRINIVIGPEGGLSINEEQKLINNEFIPVTFGNRIFRVETVPIFIMSIVNYEFME